MKHFHYQIQEFLIIQDLIYQINQHQECQIFQLLDYQIQHLESRPMPRPSPMPQPRPGPGPNRRPRRRPRPVPVPPVPVPRGRRRRRGPRVVDRSVTNVYPVLDNSEGERPIL